MLEASLYKQKFLDVVSSNSKGGVATEVLQDQKSRDAVSRLLRGLRDVFGFGTLSP